MFLYAVVDARVNAWFFGEQGRHGWSHLLAGKARHMQSIKPHPGDLELRRDGTQKTKNSEETELRRHRNRETRTSEGETELSRRNKTKESRELKKRNGTQERWNSVSTAASVGDNCEWDTGDTPHPQCMHCSIKKINVYPKAPAHLKEGTYQFEASCSCPSCPQLSSSPSKRFKACYEDCSLKMHPPHSAPMEVT